MELLNLLAQSFEILAGLLERLHLPRRLLRKIVDLGEPIPHGLERQLSPGHFVGLGDKSLELFREAVGCLTERDQVLVFGGQCIHA